MIKIGESMKYRLRDIIDSIEYDELVRIKKDLDAGGFHLKKFIEDKIKEEQKTHEQFCATCSSKLDTSKTHNFTIIFGPDDFKKKASFCGTDCLEYFLKELKEMKMKKQEVRE